MAKRNYTSDFNEIQAMANKIKSMRLNESLFFEEDYMGDEEAAPEQMRGRGGYDDREMVDGEYSDEKELGKMQPQNADEEIAAESQDPNSAVNRIREIALKGMVALCNTPEDPQYEVLKKVFQLIDKANDKKNEEREQGRF